MEVSTTDLATQMCSCRHDKSLHDVSGDRQDKLCMVIGCICFDFDIKKPVKIVHQTSEQIKSRWAELIKDEDKKAKKQTKEVGKY